MNTSSTPIAAIFTLALTGCNDSTSYPEHVDITGPVPIKNTSPTFFLGVSDSPGDVEAVNIVFKQVVLKGDTNSYFFDVAADGGYRLVHLMEYRGAKVDYLIEEQPIPAGEYQVCIYIQNNMEPNTNGSHVKTRDGAIYGLVIENESNCGGTVAAESDTGSFVFAEKISINELPRNYAYNSNRFVADFDLFKGLQEPVGEQAYWSINKSSVVLDYATKFSVIWGTVSDTVMAECEAAAWGSDFVHAVYLYPAFTSFEQMRDFSLEADSSTAVSPITASLVQDITDDDGNIIENFYVVDVYVPGDYNYQDLGYTCLAQNDELAVSNLPTDISAPFFIFASTPESLLIPESFVGEFHFK
ncbi:DUF4382 domain-containing protein [Shewanella acanthi]|uniref:DUF4382 domain-containing protein n=1 Tax=Shewanella acanthi TaxID=2864212 RepID=UPI001C65948E|nr:DUF4382 domain-containing protein [Shewanella acanthi]QYJ78330.1 DUF4382 domain-containing protein [Shewanella acanthi]